MVQIPLRPFLWEVCMFFSSMCVLCPCNRWVTCSGCSPPSSNSSCLMAPASTWPWNGFSGFWRWMDRQIFEHFQKAGCLSYTALIKQNFWQILLQIRGNFKRSWRPMKLKCDRSQLWGRSCVSVYRCGLWSSCFCRGKVICSSTFRNVLVTSYHSPELFLPLAPK